MKAILPILDENRPEPFYMQLYGYLRDAITHGDIEAGERLPSLRSLARSTGLSITTVEKAYDQLLVEGYIHSKAQSGFYADRVESADLSKHSIVPYEIAISDKKLSYDDPKVLPEGLAEDPHLPPAGTTDIPGGVAGIPGGVAGIPDGATGTDEALVLPAATQWRYDPDCFDFNKWKKCMNRVLNEQSPTLFFEGSAQGEEALRIQVVRYLYQSRGVTCHPEQIVIAAGTQQITNHLATILRSLRVEHVALEDPGYTPVRNTFRDRGFAITSVEVAADGLVLEKLPANIRAAVYVSPSNHSFTGSVMPIGRRYELLRWAAANDSYIIEDDYDSELRYFGRPIPALKSLTDDARDERVIYLGSFSSTLFAAVKISYMVLPPRIAADFSHQLQGYSQTCSKLEQLTLADFMETGYYQTHLRKLRKLYAQKLSLVTETFRREAADFIRVRDTTSGITVLLEADGAETRIHQNTPAHRSSHPRRKSPAQLKQDAASLGIPITISQDSLLLYYNQIPLNEIEEALTRLIRLWRDQ